MRQGMKNLKTSKTATKQHLQDKSYYDLHVKGQSLATGDRGLVLNVGLTEKHKLQDCLYYVKCQNVAQLTRIPIKTRVWFWSCQNLPQRPFTAYWSECQTFQII